MALSPTEESQTRALIAQNAALLSLASNEAAIISELGAGDVTLADLPVAASLSDTDLFLVRQGTTERSVAKSLIATTVPDASTTVKGIVELATVAEVQAGIDTTRAVTPAGLASAISGGAVQGAFKNLQASATGLSANVSVTADEVAVENTSNIYQTLRGVSLTISGASSGVANGLDTGALAINTWYSVWVIWNGTTTAGLLSLSATAPTMPSGYTHKARIGWIRTDASGNKYPLSFKQSGRTVRYVVVSGSNVTTYRQMASGNAGSVTTPTWVAVATGGYFPTTAQLIYIGLATYGSAIAIVAPNNLFGAYNTTGANQPIINNYTNEVIPTDMMLETSNIYWAANNGSLYAYGWEDNL